MERPTNIDYPCVVEFDEGDRPHRSPDGRLMYYEHQVQMRERYDGPLCRTPVKGLRDFLQEVTRATTLTSLPFPPAGLPGHLHRRYSDDDDAWDVLRLGIRYVSAMIWNERRSMHNIWQEANDLIRDTRSKAREELTREIVRREAQRAEEAEARMAFNPQLVYFIGSESGPIKIGIAINPLGRLKTLQTSHHERLTLLATCEGGQPQEAAYHKRFAASRRAGEWFDRTPELMAEITRLKEMVE